MGLEDLQRAAEQMDNNAPTYDPYLSVTADADFIYFPGMAPRRRRHLNKWRDATESEIQQHTTVTTFVEEDDQVFYDEFMEKADKDLMKNLNPTILNALQDHSKIKKKIYIPKNPGVNYIGLIIGPQGHYQKRLEE